MLSKLSHAATLGSVSSVEIGVSDLTKSEEFYYGLLGVAEGDVSLQQVSPDADPLEGIAARGYVHVGWFVEDVDEQAKRLETAGVRFTVQPRAGVGVERLAFLLDPDGTVIELVQGRRQYQKILSEELAKNELAWGRDRTPTLDHVAIAAGSLAETLSFFRDQLSIEPIGQIDLGGPTELLATHLSGGGVAIEIFTHGNPEGDPGIVLPPDLGIRAIQVVGGEDPHRLLDPNGAAVQITSDVGPEVSTLLSAGRQGQDDGLAQIEPVEPNEN